MQIMTHKIGKNLLYYRVYGEYIEYMGN